MNEINHTEYGSDEKRPYILWIEDDNFLGTLITKKLEAEGYRVEYVKSGEKAWQEVRKDKPDLILADILLPGMDGFEFLSRVKEDDNLKNIPVLLFSNLNQEKDVNRGLSLGAESFLVKSNVVPAQIIEEINKLINERT